MLGKSLSRNHVKWMKRAQHRPAHLDPPQYLSPSPPLPVPSSVDADGTPVGEEHRPDPTRYGDWEKKGIAIDF